MPLLWWETTPAAAMAVSASPEQSMPKLLRPPQT